VVIDGLVRAKATDDDAMRLIAAMAMLSAPTKRGRSKAFISSYLRREKPTPARRNATEYGHP
jgi:hypothetical protein